MTADNILPNIPMIMTLLMQWGMCIFICFFMKKRFSEIGSAILGIVALPVQYLILKIGVTHLPMTYGSWLAIFRMFELFPCLLFMVLFFMVSTKASVLYDIFQGMKAFILSETLASVSWILYMFYCQKYSESILVSIGISCTVVIIITCILVYLSAHPEIDQNEMSFNTRYVAETGVLVFFTFIFSNIGYIDSEFASNQKIQILYFLIRALVDIFGCLMVFMIERNYKEIQIMKELSAISHTLDFHYKQYLEFQNMNEYMKEQMHDFKHQLKEIRMSYTDEERQKYLDEMDKNIKLYQAQSETGNRILDSILTQKKIYCAKHNIEITFTAAGSVLSGLAAKDICTIFGNLLENAIEHVQFYDDPEKRMIHGNVDLRGNFLLIKIENYCEKKIELKNELPVSTKTDKIRHGYGLKSVLYSVKKYDGTMQCSTDKNRFTVMIMIPQNEIHDISD